MASVFTTSSALVIKRIWLWATMKNCFLSPASQKKKVTQVAGKTLFLVLFKLNIPFYFKCYLHHNYSVNLNWSETQLYSSAKPFHNVPSCAFWFVNFCFLPFLRKTIVQKWKKNWFCYVHKWIGKKEMLAKTSKCLFWNLFIAIAAHISCLQRLWNTCNFEKVYYSDFKFLDWQHKISIVLWFLWVLRLLLFYVLLMKTVFVYLMPAHIRPRLLIWKWTVSN